MNDSPLPVSTEAAMAAAREIYDAINPTKLGSLNQLATIITRHFQPLLAKVEGERDAAKHRVLELEGFNRHIQFQHDIRVKDADALRADLAAKEAALEAITRRVPIMGSTGDYREGQIHALEACRDVAASTLASRADKGGAK